MNEALHILLAEDVPADAEFAMHELARGLGECHFTVVDAREAYVAALRARRPDVIISDFRMPAFDGLEALRLAQGHCPEVPFIILTGSTNEDTAVACMKAGAWDYVIKEHTKRLVPAIRVALEQRRWRAEQRRADAERERLAMAIEQAAEMVAIATADGLIQYVNPAFESTTGYARADSLGRDPTFLLAAPGESTPARALWETVASGRTWKGRLACRRRDGQPFTSETTISPIRGAEGDITSYVAVARDITRDLALEAQLLQAQRMESIGRLAGGVAHDFNNLLSVILTCAGFALGECSDGEPLRDELLEIQRAAERATALTRQLLAFSRKQVLQLELLDLNLVVREMQKLFERILGEDVTVAQKLAAELWTVKADRGQLEQVLMNLVVNARDAMPSGGTITIETSNVELDTPSAPGGFQGHAGSYVLVSITDTGVGMDEATLSRMFEPFFTTKGPGKGTGLGLSTAYGIVRQSGGHIWATSELGHGSTFHVYLPRETSAAEGRPTASKPPPKDGRETILVVEDDPSVRAITARVLSAAGYSVLAASNGSEGLVLAANHPQSIHLLLTDVVMPQMKGPEFAERFIKFRPEAHVLFMSGYADDAVEGPGGAGEAMRFIGKPFTQAELLAAVRGALSRPPPKPAPAKMLSPKADEARPRLTREATRRIPARLAKRLSDAARAARHDEMVELLEDLRREQPEVAGQLRRLVEAFDHEGLLAVLD